MSRRITLFVAVIVFAFTAGTAWATHGSAANGPWRNITFPDCHEDSVVVLVVGHWNGSNQVAARAATVCAAVDDLYWN